MSAHDQEVSPGRRRFLAGAVATAGAAALGGWYFLRPRGVPQANAKVPAKGAVATLAGLTAHQLPILSVDPAQGCDDFIGDDLARPHAIVRQKEKYLKDKGALPEPAESVRLAIVGGGISGLASAWYLQDLQPLVLEQAARLGGNAKGESWDDLTYSIGAAYITVPDEGSNSEKLMADLGLLDKAREESAEEEAKVLRDGKVVSGFWQGATDPARAQDFERVARRMAQIYDEMYPDIPRTDESALSEEQMQALDKTGFKEWAERELRPLHPHIREFFREYCWSSFAATWEEISAAQALNFISADMQGILVLPGGNAAIAQELAHKLAERLPPGHIRTGAVVCDIHADGEGVLIYYENAAQEFRCVRAERVVFAAPKFVAKHVIRDLKKTDPGQFEAMDSLEYRAYLVANIALKEKLASPCYELFRLTGRLEGKSEEEAFKEVPFTDLIFGGWAAEDRSGHSALTLYRGVPLAQGRADLLEPGSFAKIKQEFEADIPAVLAALDIPAEKVHALRIAWWGHALPVAKANLLASGLAQEAAAPIGERIVFAQQDNWANPAFETALNTAEAAAAWVRERM